MLSLRSLPGLLGRAGARLFSWHPEDAVVVVEVCFPDSVTRPMHRFGGEDSADSSGSCSLRLSGLTRSGQAVYHDSLYHPRRLVYFRIGEEEGSREFVFKKNYPGYTSAWSDWQPFEYAFDKTQQKNSFFWLATRDQDRTQEIGRLEGAVTGGPKARFKVVPFHDYLQTVKRDIDLSLEQGLPDCPR
jgi:hypothetical protein